MSVRRNFSGVGATLAFSLSFSNCWRSVFPLRWFCTEQIFVLVSIINLGLSKWNFQSITNFVTYIINMQSYQNTNKITFHSNSLLFACFSVALECCKCARMRFHCLRTRREHCWRCTANGRSQNALSFLRYKGNAPCYRSNDRKTLRWQQ